MKKILIGLVLLVVMAGVGWGQIPKLISFQGRILPRPDTGKGIVFKIGTLYNEYFEVSHTEAQQNYHIFINEQGLFSINLGQTSGPSGFPVNALKGGGVELEILVDNVSIGKQRLTSVPYAVYAMDSETVGGKTLYQITSEVITQAAAGGEWIKSGDFIYRMGNVAIGKSPAGYPLDVRTEAPNATAVQAEGTKVGVLATATAANGWGVFGGSQRVGVYGLSVNPNAPSIGVVGANPGTRPLDMGVYGGSPNIGVVGGGAPVLDGNTIAFATANTGVWGAGSQVGVLGTSATGVGVFGRGPVAARFEGTNINKFAVEIESTGRALDVRGGEGAILGSIALVNIKNASLGSSATALRAETAGGGHAGSFVNESNLAAAGHATLRVRNKSTSATGGTAGYFISSYRGLDVTAQSVGIDVTATKTGGYGNKSGIGISASSAKIGDSSRVPIIKTAVWKKKLNSSGNLTFASGLMTKTPLIISLVVQNPAGYWTPSNPSNVSYNWTTGVFTITTTHNNKDIYLTFVYTEPENEPPME